MARQGICNNGRVSKRSPAFDAVWAIGSANPDFFFAFHDAGEPTGRLSGPVLCRPGTTVAATRSGSNSMRMVASANEEVAPRLDPLLEPFVFLSFRAEECNLRHPCRWALRCACSSRVGTRDHDSKVSPLALPDCRPVELAKPLLGPTASSRTTKGPHVAVPCTDRCESAGPASPSSVASSPGGH